jgi:NAD(P)-dependent dehydrogenase (short-subunit alcohol dehydrogenase family)
MPNELRNKVVVITGGGGGIGRATAERCAARGARVALLDVDETGLAQVAAVIISRGGDVETAVCDIRDRDACTEAIRAVIARWGGIDVLINNAGISHDGAFATTDVDVIRRVMDVNFFGAVHCTDAALDSIVERRGTIVAISSVAGYAPLIRRTGYAASKHALHGFFDSLRAELRDDGVNVLVICPAYADTAIDEHAIGADKRRKKTVGRLLSSAEVAQAVVSGVEQRRERVRLSWVAESSYWLWTLLPATYERIMRRNS